MIKLTLEKGPVWVARNHITYFHRQDEAVLTLVRLSNLVSLYVEETPEEIQVKLGELS